jgi:hypothetical protein
MHKPRISWLRELMDVLFHGLPPANNDLDEALHVHSEALFDLRDAVDRNDETNATRSQRTRATRKLAESVLRRVEGHR